MSISLKNIAGSGNAVEIGEVIIMQDQPEPTIELDGMTFLKSGNVLYGEEENYPEVHQQFGGKHPGTLEDWIPMKLHEGPLYPPHIYTLTYGGDQWLMGIGKNQVKTSADGIIWSTVNITKMTGQRILTSSYGNGKWLIGSGSEFGTGQPGSVALSEDGKSWTVRNTSTSVLASVYANGKWLIARQSQLESSTDGETWTGVGSPFESSKHIRAIAYGNGLWVIAGDSGKLATSEDGMNWTQRESGFGTSTIRSLIYENDLWVAVGNDGKSATSRDCITWVLQETGVTGTIHQVVNGNNQWVALQNENIGGLYYPSILISEDGVSWSKKDMSGLFTNWARVMALGYGNGTWLVAGEQSQAVISLPKATIGLKTYTQDSQSTQYMRIK